MVTLSSKEQRKQAAAIRRERRLRRRNGDRQYFTKIRHLKRDIRNKWKAEKGNDKQKDQLKKDLVGQAQRSVRRTEKERVRTQAKKVLASGKGKIKPKDHALLSADLRRRIMREVPQALEVVS